MINDAAYTSHLHPAPSDGAVPLVYRAFAPAAGADEKHPLVIVLHGYGERGSDNRRQFINMPVWWSEPEFQAKYPCHLLFPQCPDTLTPAGDPVCWIVKPEPDWSHPHFTKQPSPAMATLLDLVAATLRDTPSADPARVYVTGISMGGLGTLDLCARMPDVIAAAAPVCGAADTATVPLIRHIPLWFFHGADDLAVSADCSRRMVNALREAGATPGHTEYPPGWGHASWIPAYRDTALPEWLFRQRRA